MDLFHVGPSHGGHKSRICIHETVADQSGNHVIPAWGPKARPRMTELHQRDPQLSTFEVGYEPRELTNLTARADSVRASDRHALR